MGVVTSVPTPYRDAFWNALASQPGIELQVFYLAAGKPDRPWQRDWSWDYQAEVLPGWNLLGWRGPTESCYLNRGIKSRIEDGGFDVLLVGGYNHPSLLMAMRTARSCGVPYLLMCESFERTPPAGIKRVVKRHLVNRVVRHASGGLPTGSRASDYLVSYGASRDRLWRLPNLPDLRALAREVVRLRARSADVRRRLDVDDRGIILFVGRLIPKKRPGDVLRAFQRVADLKEWQLILVGDGPERGELESFVERHKLESAVRIAGHAQPSEVAAWYSAASLFVLPSTETWGVAVLEALAAGLPVIVSDEVGCQPDFAPVGPGVSVVAAGRMEELAGAMRESMSEADTNYDRPLAGIAHNDLAASLSDVLKEVGRES